MTVLSCRGDVPSARGRTKEWENKLPHAKRKNERPKHNNRWISDFTAFSFFQKITTRFMHTHEKRKTKRKNRKEGRRTNKSRIYSAPIYAERMTWNRMSVTATQFFFDSPRTTRQRERERKTENAPVHSCASEGTGQRAL